jgi:hypothetical protein
MLFGWSFSTRRATPSVAHPRTRSMRFGLLSWSFLLLFFGEKWTFQSVLCWLSFDVCYVWLGVGLSPVHSFLLLNEMTRCSPCCLREEITQSSIAFSFVNWTRTCTGTLKKTKLEFWIKLVNNLPLQNNKWWKVEHNNWRGNVSFDRLGLFLFL